MAKKEPQLVLRPSIKDYSREQIEDFLEAVRIKRMSAAVLYFANRNEKLANEQGKIQKKYDHERLMLEKELLRVDDAIARVDARCIKIDELLQEMGMLTTQYADLNIEPEDDE